MKNLIVAAAMVIFILIVMGWQRELGGMLHQKQRLQYVAEEAAASIAMDMAAAGQESEDPDKKAEESLLLQMAGAGGPCQSDVPVSAEAGFDRKGEGKADEAIVTYTKVTDVNPFAIEAFKERGQVKYDKGDMAGAKEDLQKVLEIDPERAADISGEYSAEGIEHKVRKAYSNINPLGL